MPTLNPYANDPGYYIRAWTTDLGNISYKLKPQGWKIINDWDELAGGGDITWQQINILKSVGVVYTDDTGVIYPDDEKFQPDPEEIEAAELSEADAQAFLDAILSNCELSPEQVAELCRLLGIEPPTNEGQSQYGGASSVVKSELEEEVSDGSLPVNETLPITQAEALFHFGPNYDKEYHDEVRAVAFVAEYEEADEEISPINGEPAHTLGVILEKSGSKPSEKRDFVLHRIYFDEDNLIEWTAVASQELTWEVRAELFAQVSTILKPVVDGLQETGIDIEDNPTSFEIEFDHTDSKLTEL